MNLRHNNIDNVDVGSKKSVYHYTKLSALESILTKCELWLTDAQFLNDPRELIACKEAFNRSLSDLPEEYNSSLQGELSPQNFKYIWDDAYEFDYQEYSGTGFNPLVYKWKNSFAHTTIGRHYIFSTTYSADSLAMWSAFTQHDDTGCCLELDAELLKQTFADFAHALKIARFQCGEVIYDSNEQSREFEKLLKSLLDYLLEIEKARTSDNFDIGELEIAEEGAIQQLKYFLDVSRLKMKDESFSYEKEYRFVISAGNKCFHNGASSQLRQVSLTDNPILKVTLGNALCQGLLKSVTLSPYADSLLLTRCVLFLDSLGLKDVEIKGSSIVLR